MLKKLFYFTAISFAITSTAFASAASEVELKSGVVRILPAAEKVTCAYFDAVNNSKKKHKIIAIYSENAKIIQIHNTKIDSNGMASMHILKQLNLPAHKTVSLAPGGMHVMLIEMNKILQEGEKLNLVAVYEDGSWAKLTAVASKLVGKA